MLWHKYKHGEKPMPEYLLPLKLMSDWTDDEIRDYYDSNPNLTILTYAGMLGLSGGELKEILMTDGSAVDKEEEAMAEEMGMYCTPYNPQEDC
jgi:hypothetical protein